MCAARKPSDWDKILADAAHCEECNDPVCMKVCSSGIDIRAALTHLLRIKPGIWWAEDMRAAEEFVDDAIEQSFA